MFISAFAVYCRQFHIGQEKNWQAGSMSILLALLMVFTIPAWGQSDSDYLNAMDKASGKKENPSAATAATTADEEVKLIDSDARLEMERLLSETCPEEFAIYKKFNAAMKNEVVAAFKATEGQPEKVRVMKTLNKIGLMANSGAWDY